MTSYFEPHQYFSSSFLFFIDFCKNRDIITYVDGLAAVEIRKCRLCGRDERPPDSHLLFCFFSIFSNTGRITLYAKGAYFKKILTFTKKVI